MIKEFLITVISVALVGWLLLFITPTATNQPVEGIPLGETLINGQSFLENYLYRERVKKVIQGDSDVLASLVMSDCGGGSGCYEHGEVLAKILMLVGEKRFSRMASTLKSDEQSMLFSLLKAGVEYGDFPDKQSQPNVDNLNFQDLGQAIPYKE